MKTFYRAKESEQTVFVGTVEGEPRIKEKDGKKFAVITLVDYEGGKVDIFFHNRENRPLADRVQKAIKSGAFLMVLAMYNGEDGSAATGLDFKFRGRITVRDGEVIRNILMGTAIRPHVPHDGMFAITIPVDEYINGETETKWYDVAFFDNEKYKNATQASRVLYEQNKPLVVAVCGAIKEREVDGRVYLSTVGYRITRK